MAPLYSRVCAAANAICYRGRKLDEGQITHPPVHHLISASSPRVDPDASSPPTPHAQIRSPAKCTAATHRLPDESATLERPGTPAGERSQLDSAEISVAWKVARLLVPADA